MIQLNSKDLTDPAQKHLQKVQKRIDAKPDFAGKATKAQSDPTVWQELKRQRAHLPKTNGFLERAPEALEW